MTVVRRLVVLAVVLSLALSGPFAPIARAQQPSAPPGQPFAPGQPDLVKEALKAPGQPVPSGFASYQAPPISQPEARRPSENRQLDEGFYSTFAGVATAFLVPGRAMTCALGGLVSFGVLVLTLGSGYRAATRVIEEGCGGKWVVNAEDLRPARSPMDAPITSY